jgi:hypothetical protein
MPRLNIEYPLGADIYIGEYMMQGGHRQRTLSYYYISDKFLI